MKFGIELECGIKDDFINKRTESTIFNTFISTNKAVLKGDGSVRTNEGNKPKEITIGPFQEENFEQVFEMFENLYANYIGEINLSMGLHIHVSFENEADYTMLFNKKFVSFFESELKTKFSNNKVLLSRLINNRYCKPFYPKEYFEKGVFEERYKMINWCAYSKFKTVEFRIFDAPQTQAQLVEYFMFTKNVITKFLERYTISIEQEAIDDSKKRIKKENGMTIKYGGI